MNDLITILTNQIGESKPTSKGNHSFFCPFCHHRKRKLEIQLDISSTHFGTWHCWACDAKNTSIYSLLKKLNKSPEFLSIFYELEKTYNTRINKQVIEIIDDTILQLPSEFISLSTIKKINNESQLVLNYLENRGITSIDIIRHNIGYCNSGKYKDRIIIPNYNSENVLDYFVGRYIGTKKNVPNYDTPSVNKSDIIGFENLINWSLPIYLVEGALDAISIRCNSIPLYGKNISDKLIHTLITNQPPKITIILDNDAVKNVIKNAIYLSKKLLNTKIYIVLLQDDNDPSKLGHKKIWNIINNESILFDKKFLINYKVLSR